MQFNILNAPNKTMSILIILFFTKDINLFGNRQVITRSPENVDDLYAKCKPYADNWVEKADDLWVNQCNCGGCTGCKK